MKKLPTIRTDRLVLREITLKDAKDIYDYAKRDEVGPKAGWMPHQNLKETKEFIQYAIDKKKYGQPGIFVVLEKDSDIVIGTIEIHSLSHGYKAEIGMVLHPDYWGKGFMVEASRALIIYAFEDLNLKRLVYAHFLDNYASKRLREKLGFVYEGIKRNGFKMPDGRVIDEAVSSLTDDDYYQRDYPQYLELKKRFIYEF